MALWILLMTSTSLLSGTLSSPVTPVFHAGQGRNIQPLHCVSKTTKETGVCMFAWNCLKANGTHLGTCIDRFYFGSCCMLKDEPLFLTTPKPVKPSEAETNHNAIDQNPTSDLWPVDSVQFPTNGIVTSAKPVIGTIINSVTPVSTHSPSSEKPSSQKPVSGIFIETTSSKIDVVKSTSPSTVPITQPSTAVAALTAKLTTTAPVTSLESIISTMEPFANISTAGTQPATASLNTIAPFSSPPQSITTLTAVSSVETLISTAKPQTPINAQPVAVQSSVPVPATTIPASAAPLMLDSSTLIVTSPPSVKPLIVTEKVEIPANSNPIPVVINVESSVAVAETTPHFENARPVHVDIVVQTSVSSVETTTGEFLGIEEEVTVAIEQGPPNDTNVDLNTFELSSSVDLQLGNAEEEEATTLPSQTSSTANPTTVSVLLTQMPDAAVTTKVPVIQVTLQTDVNNQDMSSTTANVSGVSSSIFTTEAPIEPSVKVTLLSSIVQTLTNSTAIQPLVETTTTEVPQTTVLVVEETTDVDEIIGSPDSTKFDSEMTTIASEAVIEEDTENPVDTTLSAAITSSVTPFSAVPVTTSQSSSSHKPNEHVSTEVPTVTPGETAIQVNSSVTEGESTKPTTVFEASKTTSLPTEANSTSVSPVTLLIAPSKPEVIVSFPNTSTSVAIGSVDTVTSPSLAISTTTSLPVVTAGAVKPLEVNTSEIHLTTLAVQEPSATTSKLVDTTTNLPSTTTTTLIGETVKVSVSNTTFPVPVTTATEATTTANTTTSTTEPSSMTASTTTTEPPITTRSPTTAEPSTTTASTTTAAVSITKTTPEPTTTTPQPTTTTPEPITTTPPPTTTTPEPTTTTPQPTTTTPEPTTTTPQPVTTTTEPTTTTPEPTLAPEDVIPPHDPNDYKKVCGRPVFPQARIVNGETASFGQWPWQISLRQWKTATFLHKCGAALLNENWAITAAHCVDNVQPEDILLRMGEYDLASESEPYNYTERRVQIVASHPKFDPRTFEYDLALLRFYEPVQFQPNIIPICIPEENQNFVGNTGFVTGWGRLYEDGPLPSKLQQVTVPVVTNSECEGMYRRAGYVEHIPNIFICAGYAEGKRDSCEGDSGGPMVIQEGGHWILGGVISWGIGCAEANQPGVYTRITEFKDWINQIIVF